MATVHLGRRECDREGKLPPVCMKCGNDAEHYVKQNFRWCPPWVVVLILAGVLVWAIIAMILTKRMIVHVPLCTEHKGFFFKRTLFTTLFVIAAIAAPIGGIAIMIALDPGPGKAGNDLAPFAFLAGAVGMLICLIIAIFVSRNGMKPTEITDDEISLTKVHEDFAEALREQRRVERERDRAERTLPRARRDEEPEFLDETDEMPKKRRYRDEDEDDDDDYRPRRRRDYDDRD